MFSLARSESQLKKKKKNTWIWWQVHIRPTKRKALTFALEDRKKSAVKHSTEKPNLLNLVNFSKIFCPRLQVNFALFYVNTKTMHLAKFLQWTIFLKHCRPKRVWPYFKLKKFLGTCSYTDSWHPNSQTAFAGITIDQYTTEKMSTFSILSKSYINWVLFLATLFNL